MYRNYYIQKRGCFSYNQYCENNKEDIINNTCENVQDMMDSCKSGFYEKDLFPQNPLLAQSYVPWQIMDKTFVPPVGLKMGTIFPEIVSPYMPGDSLKQIEYIKNSNKIGEGVTDSGRV